MPSIPIAATCAPRPNHFIADSSVSADFSYSESNTRESCKPIRERFPRPPSLRRRRTAPHRHLLPLCPPPDNNSYYVGSTRHLSAGRIEKLYRFNDCRCGRWAKLEGRLEPSTSRDFASGIGFARSAPKGWWHYAEISTSGLFSAICRSRRAAPDGCRRFFSQLRTVSEVTLRYAANTGEEAGRERSRGRRHKAGHRWGIPARCWDRGSLLWSGMAPPDIPPWTGKMITIFGVLDEALFVDLHALCPQTFALPAGRGGRHARTDLSVGCGDAVPRQGGRLLFGEIAQHGSHVQRHHVHVHGKRPVGGELPFRHKTHQPYHLSPDARSRPRLGHRGGECGLIRRIRAHSAPLGGRNPIKPMTGEIGGDAVGGGLVGA